MQGCDNGDASPLKRDDCHISCENIPKIVICGEGCTLVLFNNSVDEYLKKEATMAKVLGMHALELKPGVNAKEFEEFAMRDVLPLYQKVPGQFAYLLIGDRGERSGKYLAVIEIESPEQRDRIYPPEGGVSEEAQKILEGTDPIWEKLSTFVVEFPDASFTDYVMVST